MCTDTIAPMSLPTDIINRWFPNGITLLIAILGILTVASGREPGELKHLSNRRKRNQQSSIYR